MQLFLDRSSLQRFFFQIRSPFDLHSSPHTQLYVYVIHIKSYSKSVPITSMYVCICINLGLDLELNLRSNQRNYSYFIPKKNSSESLARSQCRCLFTCSSRVSVPFLSLSFLTFYIFVAVIHQLLFSCYLAYCHHPSCRFSLCISYTSFALDSSNVH